MKLSFAAPNLTLQSAGEAGAEALSRRSFLILLASLAAATTACTEDISSAAFPTDTLTAYVDVLVPADEFGPSASEVGVHQTLIRQAESDPAFRQLLILGFRWIGNQTGSGFLALSAEAKEQLLLRMSGMPLETLPRALFDFLRYQCFAAYYANPRAWAGLAIDRPPQPIGYPDFAR